MYSTTQKLPQRTVDAISTSCMILFALFSFFYLYFLQAELLSEAQFAFSHGVTTYSHFFGALMITVILILVQFVTARLSKLSGKTYAVTYFPSFMLLAVLSSIDRDVLAHFSFGSWTWIMPLLLVLYGLVVVIIKQISFHFSSFDDENHVSRYLWPNHLIMLIMILWCGSMQNADDVFMYELKAEQYIIDGKYEKAANVGKESLKTSPRLNQLRCYALAQLGKLGEGLFDYPQPYGGAGLIDISDTMSYERFTSRDVCEALGTYCGKSIKSVNRYFEIVMESETAQNDILVGDYYLCNRLLNNDLQGFLEKLPVYYNITDSTPLTDLPRIYKEALVVEASAISEDSLNNFCDSLILQSFRDYNALQDEYKDDTERLNYSRRNFGNTFFFHKDYSDNSVLLSEYDR